MTKFKDRTGKFIDAAGYPLTIWNLLKSVFRNPIELIYLYHYCRSVKSQNIDYPWITYAAIHFIKKRIKAHHKVLEFGSGSSTLFFAKHVAELVSVEHDPSWFNHVKSLIGSYENVRLVLEVPFPILNDSPCFEDKDFPEFAGLNFFNYVNQINHFPDSYFDFILIDGRARVDILRVVGKKCKSSGFIILDNSERDLYWSTVLEMNYTVYKDFLGIGPRNRHIWRTSILKISDKS